MNLGVDVLGWFDDGAGAASAGQLAALQPSRLLDTRSAAPDATWSKSTEPGVGGPFNLLRLKIVGRGGVPATAGAVILNVTAVSPSSAGYLTVGAAVALPPSTSNLNFAANQTVSNLVVANIAADGTVSIVGPGPFTDTAVDVQGYFSS